MDLCTLDDVKLAGKMPDGRDDRWLALAISSVSSVFETEANRWLAPRPSVTRYFDGVRIRNLGSAPTYFGPSWVPQYGRILPVPDGVRNLTYLGVADTDQPDDGTGVYTQITRGIHLRGALQEGWPCTRVELDATAPRLFPVSGYNVVKTISDGGPAAVFPRIRELSVTAVLRSWRARDSGGEDVVAVGPGGGASVLRRIAPSELKEVVDNFALDTRPAFASVPMG